MLIHPPSLPKTKRKTIIASVPFEPNHRYQHWRPSRTPGYLKLSYLSTYTYHWVTILLRIRVIQIQHHNHLVRSADTSVGDKRSHAQSLNLKSISYRIQTSNEAVFFTSRKNFDTCRNRLTRYPSTSSFVNLESNSKQDRSNHILFYEIIFMSNDIVLIIFPYWGRKFWRRRPCSFR